MIAAELAPGDSFTLPSGAHHVAAEVNAKSHRVDILTTMQIWVSLFPGVVLTTSPTT